MKLGSSAQYNRIKYFYSPGAPTHDELLGYLKKTNTDTDEIKGKMKEFDDGDLKPAYYFVEFIATITTKSTLKNAVIGCDSFSLTGVEPNIDELQIEITYGDSALSP